MNKLFRCGALAAALAGLAAPAAAGEIKLTITNGRVTLVAQDATVRQILAEWERVGQTQIENAEKMLGAPITLELQDVPESKALEILLRSAAGYVVAPRVAGQAGVSGYGRVVILATSQAPVVPVSAPPSFNPRQVPQQIMPPVNSDPDQEPQNMMAPPEQQFPGVPDQPQPNVPGMQPDIPGMQPQQPPGPLTAPRPGPLPAPPAGPGNPFQPQPNVRPPGTPGGPGGVPQPNKPGGGGI